MRSYVLMCACTGNFLYHPRVSTGHSVLTQVFPQFVGKLKETVEYTVPCTLPWAVQEILASVPVMPVQIMPKSGCGQGFQGFLPLLSPTKNSSWNPVHTHTYVHTHTHTHLHMNAHTHTCLLWYKTIHTYKHSQFLAHCLTHTWFIFYRWWWKSLIMWNQKSSW